MIKSFLCIEIGTGINVFFCYNRCIDDTDGSDKRHSKIKREGKSDMSKFICTKLTARITQIIDPAGVSCFLA